MARSCCSSPVIAVVTNIDADHLENYDGDFALVTQGLRDFLHRLPFYGVAVLCVDDPEVADLAKSRHAACMTYGIDTQAADVRASNLSQHGFELHFDLWLPGRNEALPIMLNLPGRTTC